MNEVTVRRQSKMEHNVPQVYLVRDLEAQTFKLVKT